MNSLKLSYEALNVSHVSTLIAHAECNAMSLFVETHKNTTSVEKNYEPESSASVTALNKLCMEIRKKWSSVMHIAVHHKLGLVNYKDIVTIVAINSPFLSDSMEAVQFAVNRIKVIFAVKDCTTNISSMFDKPLGISLSGNNLQNSCVVDDVPPDLIQISADNNEINKRIQNFIFMKRAALDDRNIKEFLQVESGIHIQDIPKDPRCARVDAVLWKRSDSKSHLKVHKVVNEWGPQAPKVQDVKKKENENNSDIPKSIDERITNCEKHVNIERPIPVDIYARLKQIEDRILELDSISPEYSNFWIRKSDPSTCAESKNVVKTKILVHAPKNTAKRKYTLEDLNIKMAKMKRQLDTK